MFRSFPRCAIHVALFAFLFAILERDCSAASVPQMSEARVIEQIEAYCRASWRNSQIPQTEWADCSQEVFVGVLDRVSRRRLWAAIQESDSLERSELNRAIWRVAKRVLRARRLVSLGNGDFPSHRDRSLPPSINEDAMERLLPALKQLSARQQQIIMASLAGQDVSSIAVELGMSPAGVSREKYRAICKLRRNTANA